MKAQLIEVIKWRYYEIINENIINLINQMNNCVLNSFFFHVFVVIIRCCTCKSGNRKEIVTHQSLGRE